MKSFLIVCLSVLFFINVTAFTTPTTSCENNNNIKSLHQKLTTKPSFISRHHQQQLQEIKSTFSCTTTSLFGKKAARSKGNDRKNKTERVKKQKDDVIEVEATVVESLPNAMFRCAINGAPETQPLILATISGKIRKNFVKILVGDKVEIELSPYDLTRGRITFRNR